MATSAERRVQHELNRPASLLPIAAALALVHCAATESDVRIATERQDVRAVLKYLGDGKIPVQRSAAQALGSLGDNAAVEPLLYKLDSDGGVGKCAAESLAQLSDARIVSWLLGVLQQSQSHSALNNASYSLALRCGKATQLAYAGKPHSIAGTWGTCAKGEPQVVSPIGCDARMIPYLLSALREEGYRLCKGMDPNVASHRSSRRQQVEWGRGYRPNDNCPKRAVAQILGAVGDSSTIKALVALLDEPTLCVGEQSCVSKGWIAYALGMFGPRAKDAVPALVRVFPAIPVDATVIGEKVARRQVGMTTVPAGIGALRAEDIDTFGQGGVSPGQTVYLDGRAVYSDMSVPVSRMAAPAVSALREITGHDAGESQEAWQTWFANSWRDVQSIR